MRYLFFFILLLLICSDSVFAQNSRVIIPEDFIMGADISSIIALENAGAKYYTIDGKKEELFKILSDNGINTIRSRLWVDPRSPVGVNGGGMNDLETVLEIARRSHKYGMKFILDFHYSDNWTHPGQQEIPYTWKNKTFEQIRVILHQYTKYVLQTFVNENIPIYAVQIGNEINTGILIPHAKLEWNEKKDESFKNLSILLKEGISAVKDISPKTKIILHIADGGSADIFYDFFSQMDKHDVEYDIIGISYYTFFHGTMKRFGQTITHITERFQKPLLLAEYSYAFTTKSTANTLNIFNEAMVSTSGYKASVKGQKTLIKDAINMVAGLPNGLGIGVVYWEPAWIPVKNVGWGGKGTKASWANQALFDYKGKALSSLNIFKTMNKENRIIQKIKEIPKDLSFKINIHTKEEIPEEISVLMDSDAYRKLKVNWLNTEVLNIEGKYTIDGIISYQNKNYKVSSEVISERNYIINSGFEDGREEISKDQEPSKPWILKESTPKRVHVQSKGDYYSGKSHLNYYSKKPLTFELSQNISELESGTYTLGVYIMGVMDNIEELSLFADNGKVIKSYATLLGWKNWVYVEIPNIKITKGKLKIGISVVTSGETWGHIDDFVLIRSK